jgi:aminoglycoside/choline kinase family phosphotransferase
MTQTDIDEHGDRFELLNTWLSETLGLSGHVVAPASGDASFRRYFRVSLTDTSYIVMDAPPGKEDCGPFIAAAAAFAGAGLNVPRVLEMDLARGFLLLTDLGQQTYLQALNDANYPSLYQDALDALLLLQCRGRDETVFPEYGRGLLMREMALFRDWFVDRLLGITVDAQTATDLEDTFNFLAGAALAQPRVWVHRDYHSRNLMVTPAHNPGVLDFQDAVIGPVTYDLVSLLRDCYVKWPEEQVEAWVSHHFDRLIDTGVLPRNIDKDQFRRWFDLMGVQRHLKAIGIFARLNLRDAKPGYLRDIPRTLSYVVDVSGRHPELERLRGVVLGHVIPAVEKSVAFR